MVGLQEHGDKMPGDLSGGEAKRPAIARALALESGIVIIDDFDAGLDNVRLTLLSNVIRDAQEDTDATVLITTHDMKVAKDLADYVAVNDYEGKLLEEKTGKPLAHWRKILDTFAAKGKKSNDVVAHLQKEHDVPRYWARTLTTWYLKQS